MKLFSYCTQSNQSIQEQLGSLLEVGLSHHETVLRQKKYGKNSVETSLKPWWYILLAQFQSPLMYLLYGAALISLILGEVTNAITIVMMVSINALLAFSQEFRAEKAVQLLNQYLVSWTRVRRQGEEIALRSDELVPGDIVIVQAGDLIPADIRFLYEYNLQVNESVLSGEAEPVRKTSKVLDTEVSQVHKALNLGFAGTTVVNGNGIGIVIAIGEETSLGVITQIVRDTEQVSGFNEAIAAFSSFILKLMVVALCSTFSIHVIAHWGKLNLIEISLFSIAMAVSAIPEILPIVTTIALSRGALKLARQKVVVKRLSAIEDLGNIEILCADKTGTLTENRLNVVGVYAPDEKKALKYAIWCAASSVSKGPGVRTAYDEALMNYFSNQSELSLNHFQLIHDLPFTPEKRRSGALIQIDNQYEFIVRGAFESIMAQCVATSIPNNDELVAWANDQETLGYRVIAVAHKVVHELPEQFSEEIGEFNFMGLIAFSDPLKKTVFSALEKAQALGVKIKIMTGDSARVAGAVAHRIGLIPDPSSVLTGEQIEKAPEAERAAMVENGTVFARVSPVQKYLIIQLLRKKYRVGFLGEGINDAPALRISNVGMVVHNATDVAKNAADIVVLQKSLRVIVDGIAEGRKVFANTVKYIRTKLASNISNFATIVIASLFLDYLPMLPIQIILLDLLSDWPMMAIATDNVELDELQQPQGYNVHGIVSFIVILGLMSSLFDFLLFWLLRSEAHVVVQTNWFIFSYFTQILFFLAARSRAPFFRVDKVSLPWICLALFSSVLVLALPYTGFCMRVFKFAPPTALQLVMLLVVLILYFVVIEITKAWFYRRLGTQKNGKLHTRHSV